MSKWIKQQNSAHLSSCHIQRCRPAASLAVLLYSSTSLSHTICMKKVALLRLLNAANVNIQHKVLQVDFISPKYAHSRFAFCVGSATHCRVRDCVDSWGDERSQKLSFFETVNTPRQLQTLVLCAQEFLKASAHSNLLTHEVYHL